MKVVAISNPDGAGESWTTALLHGYITFIYHHVDPEHTLSPRKFTYVRDDEELKEKIDLLKADPAIQEEIIRW